MNQLSHKADSGVKPEAEISEQFLTFQLVGKTFSMPIRQIKEIIEYGGLTELPLMPEFIRGVINLRGSVVPILDLAARFGQGVCSISRRSCIVIIEAQYQNQGNDIGIIVDAVNEVLDIKTQDIEPAPSFGAGIHTGFIQGMAKLQGKFVIILDVVQVLSIDEMALLTRTQTLSEEFHHA